jgi:hypothetical protein
MEPLHRRHVLFPNGYAWFVFVSSLDIMLTWVILHFGGREQNALAEKIIYRYGLPGLVIFKFVIVVFVIGLCETIGRKHYESARKLLSLGIIITCFPVALAFGLMLLHER